MSKHLHLPISEPARRIAVLYRRRLTTKWDSKKEIPRFRELVKDGCFDSLDDLALIERYYAFERKKPLSGPNRGTHRRDLPTLLNNWYGELDRAREWAETHPVVKARKIIPLPLPKSDLPPEPVEPEVHQKFLADFEASRGRKLYQPGL